MTLSQPILTIQIGGALQDLKARARGRESSTMSEQGKVDYSTFLQLFDNIIVKNLQ